MKTQKRVRYQKLHRNQTTIWMNKARFRVVACGRRFGKTELGKYVVVQKAAQGNRCWWLSPTYRMSGQVWRDLKYVATSHKLVTVSTADMRLDFPNGGMIAIRSTHTPDNLRGEGLDFAVLDEAAFMGPTVWPEVVRPMLMERRGAALFLSTPYGLNWFWEVYQLGLRRTNREWRSFHYTSFDNPLIPPEELEEVRATTPDRVFREEYLAEFIDDAGQVFRGVREAATARPDAEPMEGGRYIAGIDWGRSADATAIAIIDASTGHMVALDRFTKIGWELQRGRLRALCEHWRPTVIWAEENSIGSVNIEALQSDGLPIRPFKTTVGSKGPLVEALALAIERRDIALLPDETLLSELLAYRLERLPGGGHRYSAPPGLHDDTVIALALAWHGVRYGGTVLDFA